MDDHIIVESTQTTQRPVLSRAEAARINGAKSRGPVTDTGKSISSQNRVRHGLLARTVVLKGESHRRFSTLLNGLRAQLHPEGPVETALVDIMAACCWRRMRLWSLEKAAITHEVAEHEGMHAALAVPDNPTRVALAWCSLSGKGRALDQLSRYEGRLDSQYDRALHRLNQLRAARERRKTPFEPGK